MTISWFRGATWGISACTRSWSSPAASAADILSRAISPYRRSTGCSPASRKRAAVAAASSPCAIWSRKRHGRRCSSLTGNRHFADEHRRSPHGAADIDVGTECGDVAIHLLQISRDGHFVHRILDRTRLDPEAARPARIIAGNRIHALAHELGHEKAGAEPAQEGRRIEPAVARGHDEVVNAAGVARGLESQSARRVAAEHIAVEHAVVNELAIAGGGPLLVEGAAGESLPDVRALLHLHELGEHLRAGRFQEKGRLAVLAGAADGAEKMADQAARHIGCEGHRALAGCQAACSEPRQGTLAGQPPDARGILEIGGVARDAVPVVALHPRVLSGDERAADRVIAGRIAGEKAERVAVRSSVTLGADARPL